MIFPSADVSYHQHGSGFPHVDLDSFDILRAIGRGAFGKVCIIQKKDTKQLYALKYMDKKTCVSQDAVTNVLREIELLKYLEHQFMVNLWFTFQDDEDLYMVLDLMLGGDIRFHINSGHKFSEWEVTMYLAEVALALDYLQAKRIIHRDIKPDNLLLDDKGHIHLTDFNIATYLKTGTLATSMSGTKPYMAPEIFATVCGRCRGYSFGVDWWSLGVTICEMTRSKRPFKVHHEMSADEIYRMFMADLVLELPSSLSDKFVNLMKRILHPDPNKRLRKLEDLQKHSCMAKTNFEVISRKKIPMVFVPSRQHLNCDPTYELEEMIIESRPLHKKKKKKHVAKTASNESDASNHRESTLEPIDKLSEQYSTFNRQRLRSSARDISPEEALKYAASFRSTCPLDDDLVPEDPSENGEASGNADETKRRSKCVDELECEEDEVDEADKGDGLDDSEPTMFDLKL